MGFFDSNIDNIKSKDRKVASDSSVKKIPSDEVLPQNGKSKNFPPNFDPIEYSWEFLTRITEIVYNKFETKQKEDVLQIGNKLKNSGAIYNHIVYNANKGKGS